MKIVVTGGLGFLGVNLINRLSSVYPQADIICIDNCWKWNSSGVRLSLLKRDVIFHDIDILASVGGELEQLFRDADLLFHLADIVAGIGFVFGNEFDILTTNALIDSTVFRACAESNVRKVIYAGTACSYPESRQREGLDSYKLKESEILPASPESGYGWSKLYGELCAQFLGSERVPTSIARFHNLYGPMCSVDPRFSQVIPSLCYKIALAPEGGDIEVWGSGQQKRSFLFVEDAVSGLLAISKYSQNVTVQFGVETATPINDLVRELLKISGRHDLGVRYTKPNLNGDFCREPDLTLAGGLLGWEPQYSLADGLASTYEWIKRLGKL